MRIAVISTWNGSSWGGSEELWATMVDEALKERLEVAVSISHDTSIPSKFTALQQNAARVFQRRPSLRFGRVERAISKVAAPFSEIFRFSPDVICISQSSTYDTVFLSDLLDRLYRTAIPYVVVCQYNDDQVPKKTNTRELAREFFERAFRVVFVSRNNIKSAERQIAQALPNAIVLQNPVNLFDLSAVPWSSSGPMSMASIARLEAAFKGQDILLEVLGSPLWHSRNWRLRLYGKGPDRNYLQALAEHYAIGERVEFGGHINDIRSIWAVNQVLVLPSRAEGTPLALVEAMLCGRPAVVTDVGGNAEWIEDQQTGFVAEAPSALSFGRALDRAWLAQADWQKIGLRAREYALINFDKAAGKSLLKVLLDASGSSQARRHAPKLMTYKRGVAKGFNKRGEVESLAHISATRSCDLPCITHKEKQPGQSAIAASVIVPTYERPRYLREAVASLLQQDFPAARYEIIAVDNKPTGEVRKIVQELQQDQQRSIRYVEEQNVGLHHARHTGAREARGKILVYVDDDVVVQPNWLSAMVAPFDDPQVACVGGKTVAKWETGTPPNWLSRYPDGYLSLLNLGEKSKEMSWPEGAYGCNMAVRCSVLYEVGGFNPDNMGDRRLKWLRGDGETGLQKKIYDSGYKVIYNPQAWIYHCIPASRLTPEYFHWRAFTQGISDSYTRIRQYPSRRRMLRHAVGCFLCMVRCYIKSIREPAGEAERKNGWYWYGRGQHQVRVALSPELYRHVMQDTYLLKDNTVDSGNPATSSRDAISHEIRHSLDA